MQYSLSELRQKIFGKVYEVYEVFQNYFGEEFTDLQKLPDDTQLVDLIYAYTDIVTIEPDCPIELSERDVDNIKNTYNNGKSRIMVWWPEVTVTNENDRSVKIKDLFAEIDVTIEGTIPMENHGFKLNRSTYTRTQAANGYRHSHLPGHYDWSHNPAFDLPCLGTGPIKRTIVSLKTDNSAEMWMLFCNELAMYVIVESLTGVPYKKLEQINNTSLLPGYVNYSKETHLRSSFDSPNDKARLQEFAYYYLKHGHLAINYCDGKFCVGMPYYDYMIDISNSFIEWFNANGTVEDKNRLLDNKAIIESIVKEGQFYSVQKISRSNVESCNGRYMFTFKDRRICLLIEEGNDTEEQQTTLLLNHNIAMFLLYNILRIINYRYTNGNTNNTREGQTAPVSQTVYYI